MAINFQRGPSTTQPVAPFLDRSMGILALGGGLLVINFFVVAGRPLTAALFHGVTPTNSQVLNVSNAPKSLALQALLLLILFVLAKLDEDAGSFGLTLVLALWGLWLYSTFAKSSSIRLPLLPRATPPHIA